MTPPHPERKASLHDVQTSAATTTRERRLFRIYIGRDWRWPAAYKIAFVWRPRTDRTSEGNMIACRWMIDIGFTLPRLTHLDHGRVLPSDGGVEP